MDKISKVQRSRNMSLIRSAENKTTEQEILKYLRKYKITGWRRHKKGAFGSPDFLFTKNKVVMFVDGCFWHRCNKHCIIPKSNKYFWITKLKKNKVRDKKVNAHYKNKGWKVVRIWEHELKKPESSVIYNIVSKINK
jgi:DNA mismatch endonuclease, patch repair protein